MKRITDRAELAAYRRTFVPVANRGTCQHHRSKLGDAEAWTWTDTLGRACTVVFLGRAQKPVLFAHYRKAESMRAGVAEMFARAAAWADRNAKAREEKAAARAKPHALVVGDVLRASWGYDQTNIDYYEVTRLIGTQMVEAREISAQSSQDGFLQGESVPHPGAYRSEPKRYRVSDYGARDSIRIASYASATKMYPREVGGVKVYSVSRWTAYA